MTFRSLFSSLAFVLPFSCAGKLQTKYLDSEPQNSSIGCLVSGQRLVQVQFEEKDQFALIGGDMLLPLERLLFGKQTPSLALAKPSDSILLWKDGRVPYVLPADFPYPDEMKFMVDEWAKAGVSWVPKTPDDKDYVRFEVDLEADYCGQSQLGRVGGEQILRLASPALVERVKCRLKRTFLHEGAHALGFMHEHQRSDRDDYLYFSGDISNETWLQKWVGSVHLSEFDVESVTMNLTEQSNHLMYQKNKEIIPITEQLSRLDIEATRRLYFPKPSPTPTPSPMSTPKPDPGPSPTLTPMTGETFEQSNDLPILKPSPAPTLSSSNSEESTSSPVASGAPDDLSSVSNSDDEPLKVANVATGDSTLSQESASESKFLPNRIEDSEPNRGESDSSAEETIYCGPPR